MLISKASKEILPAATPLSERDKSFLNNFTYIIFLDNLFRSYQIISTGLRWWSGNSFAILSISWMIKIKLQKQIDNEKQERK